MEGPKKRLKNVEEIETDNFEMARLYVGIAAYISACDSVQRALDEANAELRGILQEFGPGKNSLARRDVAAGAESVRNHAVLILHVLSASGSTVDQDNILMNIDALETESNAVLDRAYAMLAFKRKQDSFMIPRTRAEHAENFTAREVIRLAALDDPDLEREVYDREEGHDEDDLEGRISDAEEDGMHDRTEEDED